MSGQKVRCYVCGDKSVTRMKKGVWLCSSCGTTYSDEHFLELLETMGEISDEEYALVKAEATQPKIEDEESLLARGKSVEPKKKTVSKKASAPKKKTTGSFSASKKSKVPDGFPPVPGLDSVRYEGDMVYMTFYGGGVSISCTPGAKMNINGYSFTVPPKKTT